MARTASGDSTERPVRVIETVFDSKRVGVRILLRSPSTRDIENGILFRPQGIIHAFPATSLPSAKFARIQAVPYRGLEGTS